MTGGSTDDPTEAGEGARREARPPGVVSTIRGRYQAPGLAWLTRILVVLGLVTVVLPDQARIAVATVVVGGVIAGPLLRVAWLVFRWSQERDRRFILLGSALLAVVGVGVVLAALGLGS